LIFAVTQLPGFLHNLQPVLDQFGYLAVTGFVLLEDFGVPVPGETILILGAVYAGTGRLEIWLVGVLGFLGAVVGDNIGFAIGHFGGRPLVAKYGRYVFLTSERLDKATGFFERRGARIIVVARFIEGLRQANGIIAGISGMHWARFLAYNALGAALWVGLWTCVGYFAGDHITPIYNAFTKGGLYVLIALAVLLAVYIARRVIRARRRRAEAADEKPGSATPSAETTTAEAVQPAHEPTSKQTEGETPTPPLQQAAQKLTARGQPAPASVPHPPPPEPKTAADRSEDPAPPS
jgi:membrane protein DedA with SNARE-associated domain